MPYVSLEGECYKFVPNNEQQIVAVCKPNILQGNYEEADTLIAFHVARVTYNVVIRASETAVLILLIGYLGDQLQKEHSLRNIIIDCGIGKHRKYIDVNSTVNGLEIL